jgi:dienelactone hydrolase
LPLLGTSVLIGACVVVTISSFPQPSLRLAAVTLALCLGAGVLGATIATATSASFAKASILRKMLTGVLLVTALGYIIGFVWHLADDGNLENLSNWRPRAELMPPTLSASDPASTGPYRVNTMLYGVGTDVRRPEYGSSVAIRTRAVDASGFFRGVAGWRRWVRGQYWGFDLDSLPLNGRAWYPDGVGPFPLVLIVHGNHAMADYSDNGYQYLGEMLASRGFILASIDENFLNGPAGIFYAPLTPELGTERAVRGWLLLEHLRLWHEWNRDSTNPFYGKVDVNRIALIGHSRGGEAAATAAAFNRMKYYPEDANIRFNYGFGVQAIVAISPPDGQYQPAGQPRWIQDVSYLALQGGHDADVSTFGGSRQADRVRYSRAGPWFSAEVWAYRANHGQFNTEWGRADFTPPRGWFLTLEPLMPGEEQRRISKTYIAAFLEAALNEHREYLPLFKDWRTGRHWLPDTIYINRYRDASYVPLATFQEDADLTSTTAPGGAITGENLTLWREGRIPTRSGDRGYNGLFLGWQRTQGRTAPVYSVSLPNETSRSWRLTDETTIEFSLATLDQDAPVPPGVTSERAKAGADREPPDFSIELVTSDGATFTAPASRFAEIAPPLKQTFTKVDIVERDSYARDWEPVFQTIRAPLSAFAAAGGSPFEPRKLVALRLRFDRTANSVICISGIGLGSE